MASFETALRALNAMKEDGVIAEYAVAGGMAQGFWVEAIATYDLDVLVCTVLRERVRGGNGRRCFAMRRH